MDKRTFLKITSIALTGSMFNPPFLYRPDQEIGSNWAGNYHYKAKELHAPEDVAGVQGIVKRSKKVSVLGSRHSFNSIADTSENLISVDHFKQIHGLDTQAQTVTAGGGIKYGELAVYLQDKSYALHNLASLPHISVAGACATATHGSGIQNGNLATAIAGLQIIDGKGDVVTLSRERDGDRFKGAVVGLGALGMVTNVTLDVQPTYDMQQYIYRGLPLAHLEDHFDEIMSAGYSVSLFTDWKGDTVNQVWIKRRMDGKGSSDEADPTFFDASLADRHMHPIADISAENCTRQMGMVGPWHERLPHFRMNFTPSSGDELQSEFFVPREDAYAAISEIYAMSDQISPHLLISEIRTIAEDDLWMSMAYGRPSVALHFTWKPDWPAVKKVLPVIEQRLARFDVRPHWGKLFTVSPEELQSRYPRINDFRELAREFDPEGKFRNSFLDSHIFA